MLERLGLGGPRRPAHPRALRRPAAAGVPRPRAAAAPDLLLLDEPTSGVDVRTRHEVLHLLDELNGDGIAIVLTTHDLNGIAAHLPHLVCLNRRVLGAGAPAAVLTPDVLERTYGARMDVLEHAGMPIVVRTPAARHDAPTRLGERSCTRGSRWPVAMIDDAAASRYQFEFFRNGVIVATLAGALCGLVGVYVVLRNMSYIGHGMSHAIFGGFAASALLGRQLLPRRRRLGTGVGPRHQPASPAARIIGSDAAIGVITTASFAIGLILGDLFARPEAELRRGPVRQHPRRHRRRRLAMILRQPCSPPPVVFFGYRRAAVHHVRPRGRRRLRRRHRPRRRAADARAGPRRSSPR